MCKILVRSTRGFKDVQDIRRYKKRKGKETWKSEKGNEYK